jgi:hypothetical protein
MKSSTTPVQSFKSAARSAIKVADGANKYADAAAHDCTASLFHLHSTRHKKMPAKHCPEQKELWKQSAATQKAPTGCAVGRKAQQKSQEGRPIGGFCQKLCLEVC